MSKIVLSTPARINILLMVLGAIGGALASIPLTWIGKVIAGAPEPATITNYVWNMCAFGIMGALFSPMLTWSAMRRVPLWRTIVEPAIGGLVGAVVGFFLASTGAFLALSAAGIGLAAWRLNFVFRDTGSLLPAPVDATSASLPPSGTGRVAPSAPGSDAVP